jgi:hypothetical protein
LPSTSFGYKSGLPFDHVVIGLGDCSVGFVAAGWIDVFALVVYFGGCVQKLLKSFRAKKRRRSRKS